MKKVVVILLSASFLVSNQLVATASNKTLRADKSVTVSFPGAVTLKKTGCQKVPVKFAVGKMPTTAWADLVILDDSDSVIAGKKFYVTPSFSDNGKVWKKNGTFFLTLCRNDWTEDVGNGYYQDRIGAQKGIYQIIVRVWPAGIQEYGTVAFK